MHAFTSLILASLCLLLNACAHDGGLGRLERDPQVTALFESSTVLPGHRYFAFGPEAEPDALVAIDDTLVWSSSYWNEVSPTPEYLNAWRRQQQSNILRRRTPPYGAAILNPEGRRVGIWYGWPDFVVIRFPATEAIQIYPPEPTSIQRMSIFEGGATVHPSRP